MKICMIRAACIAGLASWGAGAALAQSSEIHVRGSSDYINPALGFQGSFDSSIANGPYPNGTAWGWSYDFPDGIGTRWSLSIGGSVPVTTSELGRRVNAVRGPLSVGLHRITGNVFGTNKFPLLELTRPGIGCFPDGAVFVHESEIGSDGAPTKLAFDFSMRCLEYGLGTQREAGTPIWGSFRQGSSIPAMSDRVYAVADRERAVLAGAPVVIDGGRSWSMRAPIVTYQWSHVAGPAVDLDACQSAVCSFAAPLVARGGQDVVLQLTVIDKQGRADSDQLVLHVRHRADRQSMVRLTGPTGGWFLGGMSFYYWSEHDGYFHTREEYSPASALELGFSSLHSWNDLSITALAPPNQSLVVGLEYESPNQVTTLTPPAAGLSVGFQSRAATTEVGSYFIINSLIRDGQNPALISRLGLEYGVLHTYFGQQWTRGQIWIDHQAATTPQARAEAPATVTPGNLFTVDARLSSDAAGGGLVSQLFQTKGPRVEVVDDSTPGVWTLAAPPGNTTNHLQFSVEVEDINGGTSASIVSIDVVPQPIPSSTGTSSSGTGAGNSQSSGEASGGGAMDPVDALVILLSAAALRLGAVRRLRSDHKPHRKQ